MLMAPAFETLPQGRGRRLMRGWAALAVASLALAGLFAVLLVLSRMPVVSEMVPWPAAFFEKGLVAHVALSFAVWFLAVLACFAQWAAASSPVGDRTQRLGEAGLVLAVTGTVAIITPAFFDGEPTLNNYIPVIIDPIFYGGLVLFGLGILIAVLRMLMAFARAPNLLGAWHAADHDRRNIVRRLHGRVPAGGVAPRRISRRPRFQRAPDVGRRPYAAIRQSGDDADRLGAAHRNHGRRSVGRSPAQPVGRRPGLRRRRGGDCVLRPVRYSDRGIPPGLHRPPVCPRPAGAAVPRRGRLGRLAAARRHRLDGGRGPEPRQLDYPVRRRRRFRTCSSTAPIRERRPTIMG